MALSLVGASGDSTLDSSRGLSIATWATAGRPSSPVQGQIGFNTTFKGVEVWNGLAWILMSGGPAFNATQISTIGQSISLNTFTVLSAETENFDTNGCFNNTSSTVTLNGLSTPAYSFCPNVAGYYQFNAGIRFSAVATQVVAAAWVKNNSPTTAPNGQLSQQLSNGTNGAGTSVSNIIYLNGAGDYANLQMWLNGSSGATQGLNNSGDVCWIGGALIRGAL